MPLIGPWLQHISLARRTMLSTLRKELTACTPQDELLFLNGTKPKGLVRSVLVRLSLGFGLAVANSGHECLEDSEVPRRCGHLCKVEPLRERTV